MQPFVPHARVRIIGFPTMPELVICPVPGSKIVRAVKVGSRFGNIHGFTHIGAIGGVLAPPPSVPAFDGL